MRKFSKLAGVSRMTVSRVFSGSDKVGPETRARLISLAARHDFRPCAVLPSSRNGITRSVGVLYPGFGASYFSDIAKGLQDELMTVGFLPVILAVTPANLRACFNRLIDHRVDGIVTCYYAGTFSAAEVVQLRRHKLPIVIIGPIAPGLPCDLVETDDLMGGRLAAGHLAGLGHRVIGVCIGNNPDSIIRFRGFTRELAARGLRVKKAHVARHFTWPAFKSVLNRMLSRPGRPTALFAMNDLVALDIYRVARELGMKVPADLSVMGFADLAFTARMAPPLTTIKQDGVAEGRAAARLIIRRIKGDKTRKQHVRIPAHLVARDSTIGNQP